MPRRNLHVLLVIAVISVICYRKVESDYRSRHGRMFTTLGMALREIENNYLEPVDPRNLFEGAMVGMVRRLDRHSDYIGPRGSEEMRKQLEGRFGGIGIEVSWDRQTNQLTVMNPLVGTPAYEAGILPGDRIVAIEGESTSDFSLDDAVDRLRGEPNTWVHLAIERDGAAEPLEFDIERAVIQVDSVVGYRRQADGRWQFFLDTEPPLGYVRISSFGEHTVDDLRAALEQIQEAGITAAVLDLRENSGGLLKAGTDTCDLFIRSGPIVSTRGRGGVELSRVEATGRAPFSELDLVVLINKFTASASEIVAACLQDHQRAVVVGERSFGKGTVQNLYPLEDGRSTLKLTIASYWRPSGRNIHRRDDAPESDDWGVLPDEGYEVPLTDEELVAVLRARRQRVGMPRPSPATEPPPVGEQPDAAPGDEPESEPSAAQRAADERIESDSFHDPQLQRAVEYLQQLAAGRGQALGERKSTP